MNNYLSRLSLAVAFVISAASALGQSNMVLFISGPGDWVGQGQTYATTDTNAFSFSGNPNGISVGAFGFGFTFVPGTGSFSVGTYTTPRAGRSTAAIPG